MEEEQVHRYLLERGKEGGARRWGRRTAKRWALNINQDTGRDLIPLNWIELNAPYRILSARVSELGKRTLEV